MTDSGRHQPSMLRRLWWQSSIYLAQVAPGLSTMFETEGACTEACPSISESWDHVDLDSKSFQRIFEPFWRKLRSNYRPHFKFHDFLARVFSMIVINLYNFLTRNEFHYLSCRFLIGLGPNRPKNYEFLTKISLFENIASKLTESQERKTFNREDGWEKGRKSKIAAVSFLFITKPILHYFFNFLCPEQFTDEDLSSGVSFFKVRQFTRVKNCPQSWQTLTSFSSKRARKFFEIF